MKDKNPGRQDRVSKSKLLLGIFALSKFRDWRKPKRNTVLASSLLVILIIVGVWSVIFNSNTSKELVVSTDSQEVVAEIEPSPAISAKISYIEGIVEYKNDVGAWTDATMDAVLSSGMGLKTTGAASKATVVLDDGTTLRLDANTEIVFESLTEARVIIDQASGYVYNRVIGSNTRSYIIHTKQAQFQSVGTAFTTIASGDEEAVEVYQSSVKETSTNLSASEGEKLIIKNSVNPDKNETKEKLDIEKIKTSDFIKWNREQDLKDSKFKSALGFLKDFDGPKVDIYEPIVGSTIEVDSSATNGSVTIKGKTEGKATLSVQSKSLSGSVPVNVVVADDGSFDTGALLAPVGNSVFEFIATDRVGNKTTQNVKYVFKRKVAVHEQGITLTLDSTTDADKVKLSWALMGLTTPDGVKLVYGDDSDPTYPDADKKEFVSAGTLDYEIDKADLDTGKTYYFRVCRYDSDTSTCDVYSNQVELLIP